MDYFHPAMTMSQKYIKIIKNTLRDYKLVYHQRIWPPLISQTVLKYISQNSNFMRVTILRNELFSPCGDDVTSFTSQKYI